MHIILNDKTDKSHKRIALLDTGANANFVSDKVISAFNLKSTSYSSDEGFVVGDGKNFLPSEQVVVQFWILCRDGSSYSDPYKETFLVVPAGEFKFDFILGQKFCKENQLYERNRNFAVFVRGQTKGKELVLAELGITDITVNSVQGYIRAKWSRSTQNR